MIPQSSAVLSGMSLFLMVLAMKVLIASHGVSSHLVWPFKVRLILDLLQDLMYWFSEHHVNHLSSYRPRLPNKISSGSIIVVSIWPKVPSLLRDNLSLPFPLLLVFLDPLVVGFLVKDFRKPCKSWWPHHQSHHLSHWTFPSTYLRTFSRSPLLTWP